jgi:hypothetical protein
MGDHLVQDILLPTKAKISWDIIAMIAETQLLFRAFHEKVHPGAIGHSKHINT